MNRLLVQQSVTDYVGAFARPPFSLWGDGKTLLEGLFDAFSEFQVSLKDFRIEGTSEDPSTQTVKVYIGSHGQYRFRFDRVEAAIANGSIDEIRALPTLLAKGAFWLNAAVPAFGFQSHLFSFGAHCTLSEETSETFLSRLPTPRLSTFGTGRGTGVIFHAENEERSRRLQLTVDHSLIVEDGLFIQFVLLVASGDIDYHLVFEEAETALRSSLASLNLSFED